MKNLKSLEKIVNSVLKANLVSRSDDFILYGQVVSSLGICTELPLMATLNLHKQLKLPSFESVSRIRRHLQQLKPELKNHKCAVIRQKAEIDYKIYNLSGV